MGENLANVLYINQGCYASNFSSVPVRASAKIFSARACACKFSVHVQDMRRKRDSLIPYPVNTAKTLYLIRRHRLCVSDTDQFSFLKHSAIYLIR